MDPRVQQLLEGFTGHPEAKFWEGIEGLDRIGSHIRYGVDRDKKSQMITEGKIPGIEPQQKDEKFDQYLERGDRQASGYLYGHRWPTFGPMTTDAMAMIRGWMGDDPSLIEQGNEMIDRGAADSKRRGLFGGQVADIGRKPR